MLQPNVGCSCRWAARDEDCEGRYARPDVAKAVAEAKTGGVVGVLTVGRLGRLLNARRTARAHLEPMGETDEHR
jgi:hypothetical protein